MNRGERRYLVLWSARPPVNRLRVYSLCYKTAAKYRLWRDKDRTDGRAGSSSSQQCYQTLTPRLMYQPPHWQGNVRQINVWRYRVGGLNMSWSEERGVGRVWGGHRCESSVIYKSVCLSVSGKPAEPRVATLYLDTFCYWEETVWMYISSAAIRVLLFYE